MERSDPRYQAYVGILKEELIPAMGCTEPIALAYAAAKAREVLGVLPESVQLQVSGSIIKNVKSVIVPNTGHLKGMEAAAAAGIIAGSAEKELEVIAEVSADKQAAIRDYLQTVPISIEHIEQGHVFDIIVTERCGQDYARVRIADFHTNICLIEKDGKVLYEKPLADEAAQESSRADRSLLNMKDIWEFAETADLRDVADLLERQIRYNNAIAEEGLLGDYGANIGRVLLSTYGNQGITCSVPLIEYAKELHSGKEKLYRALIISNLVAIHEKTGIGTLSAYCGAVSAGAGAGAGIVYLCGDGYEAAIHTVVNALAIVSGIVCDGAKASCAAKIASSVDAALLGYNMYKCHQEFKGGDGIVMKDIETTIKGIGRLGKDGMKETNEEIIRLMIE